MQLVRDDCSLNREEKVQIFERYLSNIIIQTERRRIELTKLVNLYEFYEMAQEWMLNCSECLSLLTAKARYSPSLIHCLQTYHQEGTKFSGENFIKMDKMVLALGSKKELKQWHILWLRCQQTNHHLAKFLSAALKDSSREYFHKVLKETPMKISDEFDVEGVKLLSQSPNHSSSNNDNIWVDKTKPVYNSQPLGVPSFLDHRNVKQNMEVTVEISASPLQLLAPLGLEKVGGCKERNWNSKHANSVCTSHSASFYSEPIHSASTYHRKQPLKKGYEENAKL